MATQCFDQLVSLRILQFIHHSDWTINQPYLICKTFNNVFRSDGFTRDFLQRQLQLESLDELEKTIQIMKRECAIKKQGNKIKQVKTPKKRKKDDDEENTGVSLPQNLRDVLQIYVKCSGNGDESIIADKVNDYMKEFKKTRNVDLLDSVTKLVNNLRSSMSIRDSYENLLGGEETVFFYNGIESYEISSDLTPKFYNKLKGVYVLSQEERKHHETQKFTNEVVVFTNCGYPLLIKTHYSEEVDSYRSNNTNSESASIYSTEIFNHTTRSNQHGYFDTEFTHSTSKLLSIVQDFIFPHDISDNIKKEFKDQPQQAVKEGLIYAFFQISFGEKSGAFSSGSDEWVPFRNIEDAFDEGDEEEETEEDDEESEEEELKEKNSPIKKRKRHDKE